MGLENEIQKELEAMATASTGLPLRPALPPGDDLETRLTRLEIAVTVQRDVLIRLAREIDNLSAEQK
jgi:hypothetical protein